MLWTSPASAVGPAVEEEESPDEPAPVDPSAERIAATRMDAFRREIARRHGLDLPDYAALHAWSVEQREAFWQALVDAFDVNFHTPPRTVLEEGPAMPSAHWFPGPP